jgi:2-oxo-4-hydroxy-4-carboxy-5-ureidoimidazoline decarboxylase
MRQPGSTVGERSLDWLNGLPAGEAAAELRACCPADVWVRALTDGRPFASADALRDLSDTTIAVLDDAALAQALGGHARIGERRDGEQREAGWSRAEQADALAADADVQARLAAGNAAYEQRFGRVFLIRAAGRSAEEMYDALQARLGNDDATERSVVLDELADIVRLRLTKLVTSG